LEFRGSHGRSRFSAPMAAVVLRKPAVHRISSAIYVLRGRELDRRYVARLRTRRRVRMGRGMIQQVARNDECDIVVHYVLYRFAMQGVISKPRELKGSLGNQSRLMRECSSSS
jgi:hypothetical protein